MHCHHNIQWNAIPYSCPRYPSSYFAIDYSFIQHYTQQAEYTKLLLWKTWLSVALCWNNVHNSSNKDFWAEHRIITIISLYNHMSCTVYPKKHAHGFCFAALCCGYTLTDFPISIRLTDISKQTICLQTRHFFVYKISGHLYRWYPCDHVCLKMCAFRHD